MSEAEYVALIGVGGTLAAALLGAVGGYWLAVAKTNRDRVNRVAAAWGAISAEVESYASMASEFVQPVGGDRVMSPQWRLSTTVFQASLPALIADAAPSEREVQELLHFYREADSLNRGLDWLQEISIGGGAGAFRRDEVNELKARRIMRGGEYHVAVRALLDTRAGTITPVV